MSEQFDTELSSGYAGAVGVLGRPAPEVGFECSDVEALQQRLWVSGLRVLEPDEALDAGYKTTPLGALVPTGIRRATIEETMRIAAGPETKYPIRLVNLLVELGELARVGISPRQEGGNLPDPFAYQCILGGTGIHGVILELRRDMYRQPNVAVDTNFPFYDKKLEMSGSRRVLEHFDAYPREEAERIRYMVANLGPGSREHRVFPELSRDRIGNTDRKQLSRDLVRYVINHPAPDEIVGYAIEMHPPKYQDAFGLVIEACVGSPVGLYAHDGATMSAHHFSHALMASIDMSTIDEHYSLV